MRVLVCGGRDYSNADKMRSVLDEMHCQVPITALIYGMARGADDLAKMWAASRNVPRYGYPARWEKHGRAAGPIRNKEMLDKGKPDIVVAFRGERLGPGTADMVRQARRAKVPVREVE